MASLPLAIESETLESLASDGPQKYRVYLFDSRGTRRDYYRGLILLPNPSESGELIELAGMRINFTNGELEAIAPSDEYPSPGDWVYRHAGGSTYSKYLVNSHGRTVGLYSVAEGLRVVVSIDIDGNEVADYIEIYDGLARRVTVIVNEIEAALRFYDDTIQGKNALCLMSEVALATSTDGGGPSIGVPDRAKIFGCDYSGIDSDSRSITIRGTGNESIVDNFCVSVLTMSQSGITGGPITRFAWDSNKHDAYEVIGAALAAYGGGLMTIGGLAMGIPVVGLPVGGPIFVAGAFFVGFGAGVALASAAERLTHGEGEEDPAVNEAGVASFDWNGFCKNRVNHAGTWSRETLDEMLEKQDCPAPNETRNPAEKTSSLPGSGSSGVSPLGPWVPFSPDGLSDPDCVQTEEFFDFENVLESASESNDDCSSTGESGLRPCTDDILPGSTLGQSISSSAGELFIGYADLVGLNILDTGDPAPIDLPGSTP